MARRRKKSNKTSNTEKKSSSPVAKDTTKKDKTKVKTLEDYVYNVGTTRQASEFENATKFIINHIMKEYEYSEDICDALTALRHPDIST